MSAPDQVLVSGILSGGAPVSIHYRGGMARDGDGFFWEINGTAGDIRVSGPFGHTQFVPLSLKGARGNEKTFQSLEVPASYRTGWPEDMAPGNVARIYGRMARDLREGTRTAPSFEDAVAVHRVIASIERAAEHVRRLDDQAKFEVRLVADDFRGKSVSGIARLPLQACTHRASTRRSTPVLLAPPRRADTPSIR